MRRIVIFLGILTLLTHCKKDSPSEPEKPYLDPVAYYTFNGNADDQTKYKNHGTVFKAKLTADSLGTINTAYYFDSSYIEIPDHESLDFTTNKFSVTAWIKPVDTSYAYIVGKAAFVNSQGQLTQGGGPFSLDIFPGQARALIHKSGMKNPLELIGTTNIKKNVWQHIAVTWDGKKANLYYNGKIEATGDFDYPIDLTNGNLYIGAYKWAYPQASFKGSIDNVRIYNRFLTTEEIQDIFNNYK